MSRILKRKTPVQKVVIDSEQAGRRIDNFLFSKFKRVPKTRIYQMLRRGEVRIGGRRIRQDYRLQADDIVRIPPVSLEQEQRLPQPPEYLLEKMKAGILMENDNFIALNKPAGIVVHSGSGRTYGVIELLRIIRPEEQGLQLVHRLDRETSGCLLVARNMKALKILNDAFRQGKVAKIYYALLKGRVRQRSFTVDLALAKNRVRSGERLVSPAKDGKQSRTEFHIEKLLSDSSLARVTLKTGRTHQIRVHAQQMGHPVAGDSKYGDKEFNKLVKKMGCRRLFLHASKITLPDLDGIRSCEIHAPLPGDLSAFLNNHD